MSTLGERALQGVLRTGVFTVLGAGLLFTGTIALRGTLALTHHTHEGGLGSALSATMITALGAMSLSAAPALLTAVQLGELSVPSVRRLGTRFFEVTAAIPAAVYGWCGARWIVPWVGARGTTAATLVLALMALPTVTLLAMDALGRVPNGLREASAALGASPWQTAWRAVVPSAARGLLGALVVGFLRAVGESLAVSMVTTASDEPLAARIVRRSTDALDGNAWPTLSVLTMALLLVTATLSLLHRRMVRARASDERSVASPLV